MLMRQNKGFTLVEVLITVVIMAVGLLGLAGLQINGLRNNLSAEQRSQAAQLAYDMADRIRSNQVEAALGSASAYVDTLATAPTAVTGCNNSGSACSPAELAAIDWGKWRRDISNALGAFPHSDASVAATTVASGAIFTIIVNWDDNRDGVTDASDASVAVSFKP